MEPRHQEIPVLRDQLNRQNKTKNSTQKCLYVYDKAVTDYAFWNHQIEHGNFMISVLKENSAATFVESIPFDTSHKINTGVEGYSIYENNGIRFGIVNYRDPETKKLHRFITTLSKSINPGTIAMLYYKRWTIEKAFNNSKSNLKETKAWSSDNNSLKNQMRLTAMSYNLLRMIEELSKIQDPELIHPSDKKYTEAHEKRQKAAKKRGGFVNPLFFNERIVRISSYTIRAVQNAIMTGKSLSSFINALVAKLVPRVYQIGEHWWEKEKKDKKDKNLQPIQCKVLNSLNNHWKGLTVFVSNPQVPMDNNIAERRMRNPGMGRKNYYGSGSQWSAKLAAMMFSLFQTILLWGLNPHHWLHDYLDACATQGGQSPADISSFIPWMMSESRQQQLSKPLPESATMPPDSEPFQPP